MPQLQLGISTFASPYLIGKQTENWYNLGNMYSCSKEFQLTDIYRTLNAYIRKVEEFKKIMNSTYQ